MTNHAQLVEQLERCERSLAQLEASWQEMREEHGADALFLRLARRVEPMLNERRKMMNELKQDIARQGEME